MQNSQEHRTFKLYPHGEYLTVCVSEYSLNAEGKKAIVSAPEIFCMNGCRFSVARERDYASVYQHHDKWEA
jgi:hypothetical protein